MKRPKETLLPRWHVYRFAKRGDRLASVYARDERQALERAFAECDVPEHERFRIVVQREA